MTGWLREVDWTQAELWRALPWTTYLGWFVSSCDLSTRICTWVR